MSSRKILFSLLVACAGSASAQLSFAQTHAVIEARPGTETVTADFIATNIGKKPIKIVRIRTTCGCTSAQQSEDQIAPGETTTVSVKMDVRIDAGTQTKAAIVEIDRAPFAYELEITATIPELLKVTPTHLTWIAGQSPTTRTLALVPAPNAKISIDSAASSDPSFTCEIRALHDHWQLLVTPGQLDKRRFGNIIVAYVADGEELTRKIPLSVIKPPPSKKNKSWLQRLFSSP